MPIETILTIITTVIVTLFGKEFFGKYILKTQQNRATVTMAETKRVDNVVQALIDLTSSTSASQQEMTRDALDTVKSLSTSIDKLTDKIDVLIEKLNAYIEENEKQYTNLLSKLEDLNK